MITRVRCLFGHKFSEWKRVEDYLERSCLRCGKQEVKFPCWQSTLIEHLGKIAIEYLRRPSKPIEIKKEK